ncbi:MAG: rRNA cytosine-C5-methyltransferase [Saprospiraceae bacterium]
MEFPKSWTARLTGQLGAEAEQLLTAMEDEAVTSVRLNPAKGADLTFGEKVPWHPNGYYLEERPVFTLDPMFHAGAYYVQEASSMFLREALVQSANLTAPLTVLDLCAAPGGKSTLLLSELSADSLLLANEIVPARVPALRHNLTKWGFPNYMISNHHPEDLSALEAFFDVIVVDAPCSGEGLFRKDSRAIGEWSPEHAFQCAVRQQNIMESAIPLLKPGGVLIYSTCTFNPDENEKNVAQWLEKYPLELIPLKVPESWGIKSGRYGYHFYPHRLKGEGFFLASLRNTDTGHIRHKAKQINGLTKLNKNLVPTVEKWLSEACDLVLFRKGNDDLVGIPENLIEQTSIIANALKKRSVGIKLGALKGGKLVPSHELSQSLVLSDDVAKMELPLEDALLFLKKEEFKVPPGSSTGWNLVTHKGLGLGWVKNLQNRVNNYLPNEFRIKMDLPK